MNVFHKYRCQIDHAFKIADQKESKISQEIKDMEGMSGIKTRHFYNQLLAMEDARYLEIGTWKGSSCCAAMYGNRAKIVCIDNWSGFGGPKHQFLQNLAKFKGENEVVFIEGNCFEIDAQHLPRFNIFMYDGDHSFDSHYRVLPYYINNLDDIFIFIVDDWNWSLTREGTIRSIETLNLEILYQRNVRLTCNDTHTETNLAKTTWWNGIYVAILKKRHR